MLIYLQVACILFSENYCVHNYYPRIKSHGSPVRNRFLLLVKVPVGILKVVAQAYFIKYIVGETSLVPSRQCDNKFRFDFRVTP